MRRLNFGLVLVLAFVLTMSVSNGLAQDMCVGDFDYDGDCDGTDAARFKQDFGRSIFENPCPPDGPATLPTTGQTTSYATGDDADLVKGVAWPTPRFINNYDGTITDSLTGLIWLRDANCMATNYPGFDTDYIEGNGEVYWQPALDFVAGINDGTYADCSAGKTDWRLPNFRELFSLVDAERHMPAVPSWAPFINVQSNRYWTSTTYASFTSGAWCVGINQGYLGSGGKESATYYVWPVRGGH